MNSSQQTKESISRKKKVLRQISCSFPVTRIPNMAGVYLHHVSQNYCGISCFLGTKAQKPLSYHIKITRLKKRVVSTIFTIVFKPD